METENLRFSQSDIFPKIKWVGITMKKIRKSILIITTLFFTVTAFAQATISYSGTGTFILRERTNLRRYDNGKYVGLVSREVSSYILPTYTNNGYFYEGNFFVTQDTRRGNFNVGSGINDSIPAKFKIASDGSFSITQDNGFPTYRGFPTYTNEKIKIGDTWSAKAVRAIDPLNKGIVTKLPIYVQYKYVGDDVYNDEEVFVLTAQWATRYGMGIGVNVFDWGGDKELVKGSGSHKANIYVSKETGNALVIHDMVDETFEYVDGNQYTFRGQISQFTEYPPAIDKYKVLAALEKSALITKKDVKKIQNNQTRTETTQSTQETFEKNDEITDKKIDENIDEKIWEQVSQDDFDQPNDASTTSKRIQALKESLNNLAEKSLEAVSQEDSNPTFDKIDNNKIASKKINTEKTDTITTKIDVPYTTDATEIDNDDDFENESAPLVVVEETQAGLRLTLPNLQFMPNSPELVPGEKDRLDKIAMALLEAGDARLLIEGHTARIGSQDDEMQLSIDRAHTIAQELIKRGIPSENLICKGSGGSKPIADNSTPKGREKNRRVEITILE